MEKDFDSKGKMGHAIKLLSFIEKLMVYDALINY
jgi:hypothetical protein